MKNGCAYLAQTKSDKWVHSDSKDFKDWFFYNRKDVQASRLVRYLEGRKDDFEIHIAPLLEIKMPNNYPEAIPTVYDVENKEVEANRLVRLICS